MTPHYGIDTSILVRLATGDPDHEFQRTVHELGSLLRRERAEFFASNQVIAEAYLALQHHYGVSKSDARSALVSVLKSGLVARLHGGALQELEVPSSCGLLDRLIHDDYQHAGVITLTLDRKMSALPEARRLWGRGQSNS